MISPSVLSLSLNTESSHLGDQRRLAVCADNHWPVEAWLYSCLLERLQSRHTAVAAASAVKRMNGDGRVGTEGKRGQLCGSAGAYIPRRMWSVRGAACVDRSSVGYPPMLF